MWASKSWATRATPMRTRTRSTATCATSARARSTSCSSCRRPRPASAPRSPTGFAAPREPAEMADQPIGVVDSRLGGLTVLRALIDPPPDERVVYFGDTGRFPYGPKPSRDVLHHALQITDVLLEHDVKTLVVACNSAAAAALAPPL